MQENIQKIVEERQAEASRKNLSRKFKLIIQALGFAVRSEGGSGSAFEGGYAHSTSPQLSEGWEWDLSDDTVEGLPVADLDAGTGTGIRYFDALSSGLNLQIFYRENEELIKVTFDGILVYREIRGQVTCYLPSEQWEPHIESFYRLAQKRNREQEKEKKSEEDKEGQGRMKRLFEYLRKNWGV